MRPASVDVCARMKRELSAFSFLEQSDLPELAPYFDCRQVFAGETLWKEGESCGYVVFIIEGRLDVMKETEFEGKQVIVGVYGKGTIAGELGILDGSPRAVTAVALEDCSLLILTREKFEQLLSDHPRLGVKLLQGMLLAVSRRLRKSYERLAAIF